MQEIKEHLVPLNYDEILNLIKEKSVEYHTNKIGHIHVYVVESQSNLHIGGYIAALIGKRLKVYTYYDSPSQELLDTAINLDTVDLYELGILNISDSLCKYPSRFTKETIIEHLLSEKDLYGCYVIMDLYQQQTCTKEHYKKLKASLIDDETIEGENKRLIDLMDTMIAESTETKDDYISLSESYLTTSKLDYGYWFACIGYDASEVDSALIKAIDNKTKHMLLWGDQIHRLAKDGNYTKENQFEFNDLDNHIMYHEDKGDLKVISLTSQNANFYILFSKSEMIVLEYFSTISKHKDGQFDNKEFGDENCSMKTLLESGVTSSDYSSTNNHSPNFKASLEWLNSASIDDIRELKTKSFHVCNNNFLVIESSFEYLYWNIDVSLSVLCEEFGINKNDIIKNTGSFNLLACNMIRDKSYFNNLNILREHLFWVIGNGWEWHKDGYMYGKETHFTTDNEDISELPQGEVSAPYPLSEEYSAIMNIPKNVRPDWLEQIRISLAETQTFLRNNTDPSCDKAYGHYERDTLVEDVAKIELYLKENFS